MNHLHLLTYLLLLSYFHTGKFLHCGLLRTADALVIGGAPSQTFTVTDEIINLAQGENLVYKENTYITQANYIKGAYSVWLKFDPSVLSQTFYFAQLHDTNKSAQSASYFRLGYSPDEFISEYKQGMQIIQCQLPTAEVNLNTANWLFVFQAFSFDTTYQKLFSVIRDYNTNFAQCTANLTSNSGLVGIIRVEVGGQIFNLDTTTFAGQASQLTFYPQYYPDEYGTEFLTVFEYVVPGWTSKIVEYRMVPQTTLAKQILNDSSSGNFTQMIKNITWLPHASGSELIPGEGFAVTRNLVDLTDTFTVSFWIRPISIPKNAITTPFFTIQDVGSQGSTNYLIMKMDRRYRIIFTFGSQGDTDIIKIPIDSWTNFLFKVEKDRMAGGLGMTYIMSNSARFDGRPKLTYPNPFFQFNFTEKTLQFIFGTLPGTSNTDSMTTFGFKDFRISTGGVITVLRDYSTALPAAKYCFTTLGADELNNQYRVENKSQQYCILCSNTTYLLNDRCITASQCSNPNSGTRTCDSQEYGEQTVSITLTSYSNYTYIYNVILNPQLPSTDQSDYKKYFSLQFGSNYYEYFDFNYTVTPANNSSSSFILNATFFQPLSTILTPYLAFIDDQNEKYFAQPPSGPFPYFSSTTMQVISNALKGTLATLFFGAGAGVAGGLLLNSVSYAWTLLDMLQLMNYIMYINTPYPQNLDQFFSNLGVVNFNFLPNFPSTMTTYFFGAENNPQNGPIKFTHYGVTADFISNGGQLFGMTILAFLIFGFFKFFNKYIRGVCRSGVIVLLGNKIIKSWEWNYFIGNFLAGNLQLSLAVFLQIYNPTLNSYHNILCVVLTALCFVYIVRMTFQLHKWLAKDSKELEEEQTKKRIGGLYEEFHLESKVFNLQLSYRRYVMCYLLVYFEQVPILQTLGQFAHSSYLIYLLRRRQIYAERKANRLRIFTEAMMCFLYIIVSIMVLGAQDTGTRVNLGWIIIASCLFAMLVQIIFMWIEIIKNFKELKQKIREKCAQIIKMFRWKKNGKIELPSAKLDSVTGVPKTRSKGLAKKKELFAIAEKSNEAGSPGRVPIKERKIDREIQLSKKATPTHNRFFEPESKITLTIERPPRKTFDDEDY